jgi:hypothetical protein
MQISPSTNAHGLRVQDDKPGIWCIVSWNWTIRPVFFDDTINSERYCEVILFPFIGHSNQDKIACSYSSSAVLLLVSPWHCCATVFWNRIISKDILPALRPFLIPLIIICGKQWKALFTEMALTLSLNWRKLPPVWTVACICKHQEVKFVDMFVGVVGWWT